jgi:SAM-dependent methyltransferase
MYPIEIRHESTVTAEQQAYDTIYATRGIGQRDSFYLWFLELVAKYGSGRLLDVSCGEGTFLRFARRAGFRASGIDFSAIALQKARGYVPGIALALANAQQLPFADHSFDIVTNIGSLEHYFDPAEGVREMARVLRPGGVALVLLPNTFGLFGNIAHVLRHGEVFDDGQPLQRYAARNSWDWLLHNNGLISERVIAYERELPRTLKDLLWTAGHPSKVARILIGPLIPVNLSHILVFVCHKK